MTSRLCPGTRRSASCGIGRTLLGRSLVSMLVIVLVLGGCKRLVRPPPPVRPTQVTPFSIAKPGDPWPGGWHVEAATKFRKPSAYRLVDDDGTTVVEGTASASASGLVEFVDIDSHERPILVWKWKVIEPVQGADTTKRWGDDAPVRIMLSFAGDVQNLPLSDRLFFEQIRLISGIKVPYATLEYVWGAGAPKETVVTNSYTPRIRTILVENTPQPLGQWVSEKRDVVADYRRAFGDEPGRITAVAVYTDADATGARSQGEFGDVKFLTRSEAGTRPGLEVKESPSGTAGEASDGGR